MIVESTKSQRLEGGGLSRAALVAAREWSFQEKSSYILALCPLRLCM